MFSAKCGLIELGRWNMVRTVVWAMAVAALVFSGYGCRGSDVDRNEVSQRGTPPKPAASPSEAALNWVRAVETEDAELYMATIDAPAEHREYVRAKLPGLFALAAWTREMTDAYGPDALKGEFFSRPLLPKSKTIEGKLEVQRSGDSATVTVPGLGPVEVVRRGDGWFATLPPGEIPPPEKQAEKLRIMRAFAEAFKAVRGKIGQPGFDAAKIRREMKREKEKRRFQD